MFYTSISDVFKSVKLRHNIQHMLVFVKGANAVSRHDYRILEWDVKPQLIQAKHTA